MSVTMAALLFALAACASLSTSWLLVSRLERVGETLGISEGLLGMLAALAADAPEITSSITAMVNRQQQIGAGVVLGSNVFNLAALLGLGALVAGRIGFHRRVVVLAGAVALWIAAVCVLTVLGLLPPLAGLVLVGVVLAAYAASLGLPRSALHRLPLPRRWIAWLHAAVRQEEQEREVARPPRGGAGDALIAGACLVIVVAASVVMERAAASLGARYAIPEIVIGGLVLAAVTSLPNSVAAVYLARRGRGAAVLSTALNSNALNVSVGLLLPGTLLGLGGVSPSGSLVVAWYAALTLALVALAHREQGVSRAVGALTVVGYVAFAGSVLATGLAAQGLRMALMLAPGIAAALAFALLWAYRQPAVAGPGPGPLPASEPSSSARMR
ncbi:MAG TPA: hypothetical protein VEK76_12650 [Candidatus Binatia bacterium]|nr:hypothetical protein [Candidatus Binatia bacterium]